MKTFKITDEVTLRLTSKGYQVSFETAHLDQKFKAPWELNLEDASKRLKKTIALHCLFLYKDSVQAVDLWIHEKIIGILVAKYLENVGYRGDSLAVRIDAKILTLSGCSDTVVFTLKDLSDMLSQAQRIPKELVKEFAACETTSVEEATNRIQVLEWSRRDQVSRNGTPKEIFEWVIPQVSSASNGSEIRHPLVTRMHSEASK